MDNYIYYRILEFIIKYKIISRSDLVDKTSLHSYRPSPIEYLLEHGFIKLVNVENGKRKNTKYYSITNEGLSLYDTMNTFYVTYDKMLQRLHVKLKLKKLNNRYEGIVLLSTQS